MSRYLIVTWDGAGNLVPTLGITRALVERGHDVRMLGHDTIAERCGDTGARFVPLTQDIGWDALENPDDFEAEMKLLIEELCFSTSHAQDLARELDREPADVVLVDHMLFTAIDAALASGTSTATLFHTPYTIFRGGMLVEMLAPGLAIANARRAELGLPQIEKLGDIHDACALAIVAVPKEFEPESPDAANVLRIGPVLDAPPLSREIDEVDVSDGSTPLVLVSLSTTVQGQADLLQRCVDAVAQMPVRAIVTTGSIDPASVKAGANTQVVRYAPHTEILPSASLAITHAGLGTTMAALGRGVPLLCTPMGRDQFFNAERVQTLGAGRMLMPDSTSVGEIANAAADILDDDRFKAGAKQMEVAIGGYGGAAEAATALEGLG